MSDLARGQAPEPALGPRAVKAASTRAALVAAARRLFAENGYHATGTPELVAAAGVTRGALYHHFRDKEDLFEAVFRAVASDLEARAAASVMDLGREPWRQLQEGLQSYLRLVAASPEFQRVLLIDGPVVFGWTRWRDLEGEFNLHYVITHLELVMRLGMVETSPAEPLARLVVAAMHDAALSIANAPHPEQAFPEIGGALKTLVEGLRVRR